MKNTIKKKIDIGRIIEDAEELFQDNPNAFQNKPLNRMSVKDALISDNPLDNISYEMGEKSIQKLFTLLYAAIFEVNSAGAGILFDRYNKKEIETIYQIYGTYGAILFCNAINKMQSFFNERLGETYSDDEFFNLCDTDEYAKLDREITLQYEEMVKKMEQALLLFAKDNVEQLSL